MNVALNLLVPEAMELIFLLKHFGFCFCGTYHWCFRDSRPQKGIRMGLWYSLLFLEFERKYVLFCVNNPLDQVTGVENTPVERRFTLKLFYFKSTEAVITEFNNTLKYFLSCFMHWWEDFSQNYFNRLFFHRRPTHKFCFLSCRPFVVNETFSTGLVVFSVSWLGQLTVGV